MRIIKAAEGDYTKDNLIAKSHLVASAPKQNRYEIVVQGYITAKYVKG